MLTLVARRRALPVLLAVVTCALAPAAASADPGKQSPKGPHGSAATDQHQPLGTGVGRKVG